ncbi:MAG: AsmA-like C-terminal region-containing protein, partial [Desulfobacteraceae bacterium]|nr:AsmA-like C-terminal region-containing protein [Desulfobacteraceae bacterium]
EVDLRSPRVIARLPDDPSEQGVQNESGPSAKQAQKRSLRLKEKLTQIQAAIQASMPGIVADVDDGTLEIYSGRNRVFSFQEIELRAAVHAHGVELELSSGKSDLWDALTITGWCDLNSFKSRGEISLTGGSPQSVLAYLFPESTFRTADSQLDLTVNISTDGPRNARAEISASVTQMTIADETEKRTLQNGSIAGTIRYDHDGIDAALTRCRFDYPRGSLTGRYIEKSAEKDFSLEIEGRDLDVAAIREFVLVLGKENKVAGKIFDIVRGGDVSPIVFSAHANSRADLKESENFTLKGSIVNGTIFPPKAEILVSKAQGEVVVVNGRLEGTNLSGTTAAGSATSNGFVKVGLIHEDPTLHLDLPLKADLSELPEILDRLVPNAVLKREIGLLKDVKGKTEGRLLIGESLDDVDVTVETGPFQLSGKYERLPDPVEIAGKTFRLEGTRLSLSSGSGTSGKTKCSDVDFAYDWGESNTIELNTRAPATVTLDLIGMLLKNNEKWQKELEISTPKGVIPFESIEFRGPVGDHSKWVFQAGGKIDDLTVRTDLLPRPLVLKAGRFDILHDVITLKDVSAVLADSSLNVSGKVNGFFESLRALDLSISGHLGPQGNKDIATITALPPSMRAMSNLAISGSHLIWEKNTRTAFSGELNVASGPRVKINLLWTPRELEISELAVKDADSDASIAIKSGAGQINLKFSGVLSNKTADKLLAENTLLTGPIRGKFTAHLFLDAPKKSTAQGQLTISGFQLPMKLRVPARIETASLEADGSSIDVKSAMISWNGSRLSFGGGIKITEKAYEVDMNAFADSLDLDKILGARQEAASAPEDLAAAQKRKTWDAPVHGTIRVRSEHLSYGKLTWNPANAEVLLTPGFIEVKVNQANLCGISTPGKLIASSEGYRMVVNPCAKDQNLQETLDGLLKKQHLITGKFDLTGNLTNGAGGANVMEGLEGEIEFKARDGRIYRWETFAKIISLFNITEIYRGVLPDIFSEGCAYSSLTAKGKVKGGKLTLTDSVLDGPCVKMVFRGEIDLVNEKLNIVALVMPLRTVDRIIGAVPVLGKLLDGVFFSVPVQITGNMSDPTIIPLSPTAVGGELLGLMKRTFRLPFTLIQPLAQTDSAPPAAEKPREEEDSPLSHRDSE